MSELTTGNKATKGATKAKGAKAKAAPAKKAAKAAAKRAPRERTSTRKAGESLGYRVPTEGKIKVVSKDNPYREGTKAFATFAVLAKAGTVAAAREAFAKSPDKYDPGYLRYAARDGFIAFA